MIANPVDHRDRDMGAQEKLWPQRQASSSSASKSRRPEQSKPNQPRAGQSWSERLPALLRNAGAIAVLVSLYSFLSKGWAGSNDLVKYCMLLGNTLALSGIALLIGHFFKEGKSPRLLLTLGLVSVPINFAVLGAFVFYGASDFIGVSYPSYVAWKVDSLSTALIASALAGLALVPVIWLGFRTLIRGMSQRLTAFFILSNVLLLVPFRDPLLVAGMAIVLGLLALLISAETARQKIEAQTREGRIALLLQFLPLGILVGRNLWLYAADEVVVLAASTMTFIAIRQISFLVGNNGWIRKILNGCALLSASATGVLTSVVMQQLDFSLPFSLLVGVMSTAGMIYEISLREGVDSRFYRRIAMAITVVGSLFNLFEFGSVTVSLTILLIGSGLLVMSVIHQQRSLAITGATLTVAGVVDQCLSVFLWFDMGSWIVLLILGVCAIVTASALETQSDRIKGVLRQRQKQLGDWQF